MLKRYILPICTSLAFISPISAMQQQPMVTNFQGFDTNQLPTQNLVIVANKFLHTEAQKVRNLPDEYQRLNPMPAMDILELTTETHDITYMFEPKSGIPAFEIPAGFPMDVNFFLIDFVTHSDFSKLTFPSANNFGFMSGKICVGPNNAYEIGTWHSAFQATPQAFITKFACDRFQFQENCVAQLCEKNPHIMRFILTTLSVKGKDDYRGKAINITNLKEALTFFNYAFGIVVKENPDTATRFRVSISREQSFSLHKQTKINKQYQKKIASTLKDIVTALSTQGWMFNEKAFRFEIKK